jgi:hypothetical protein
MVVDERHGKLAGHIARDFSEGRRLRREPVAGWDRAQDQNRPAIQAFPDDRPQPVSIIIDRQVVQIIGTEYDQGHFRFETLQPGLDVVLGPADRLAALIAELRALPIPPSLRAQVSLDRALGVKMAELMPD